MECNEPDAAFKKSTEIFQSKISDASASKIKKNSKKHSFKQPWMTYEISNLIAERENLRKLAKHHPHDIEN